MCRGGFSFCTYRPEPRGWLTRDASFSLLYLINIGISWWYYMGMTRKPQ
jgi:hypothetical protein